MFRRELLFRSICLVVITGLIGRQTRDCSCVQQPESETSRAVGFVCRFDVAGL